ncbi:DNA excision repair protein ERCC-6-like [Engraulis encrasicolus]|uniref:DNA excision repair protein ERCC-6-like n=1 Tax=Engraulis encrasicolus TaxID=184585 RepID=UPI002FCE9433
MVCDEAHRLKNVKTQTYKVSSSIQVRFRILLTGTPIQNNLKELWSLLSLISETCLVGTSKTFSKNLEKPITRAREADAEASERAKAEELIGCLKEKIKLVWLRRTKEQLPKLPGKRELVLWTRLSPEQEAAYRHQISVNQENNVTNNFTLLHKLCEICSQPAKSHGRSVNSAEALIASSGKLAILIPLLKALSSEGHKTLVFFQYVETLKIVFHTLSKTEWGRRDVLFMDGTVDAAVRPSLLRSFQTGSRSILLVTLKVAAEGLTLTAADRVILMEPSWNQSTDAQAVDRAHRIGQKREVEVYRFITCGTIEEKIYRRQLFKDSLVRQVVGDDQNPYRYFTHSELMDLSTLGDTQQSSTQLQLERQHGTHLSAVEIFGREIEEQVSLSLCGISDHGKLLKANQDDDLEAEMEKLHIAEDVQKCKEEIEDEVHVRCRTDTENKSGRDTNLRKSLAVHLKEKAKDSNWAYYQNKQKEFLRRKTAPGLPPRYKSFSFSPFSGSRRREKSRQLQRDSEEESVLFSKDKTSCGIESISDDVSPERQRDATATENNTLEISLSKDISQHGLTPDTADLHSQEKNSFDIRIGNIGVIKLHCSTLKSITGTDSHFPLKSQSPDQSKHLSVLQTPISKPHVNKSSLSDNSSHHSLSRDSVHEDSQCPLNETRAEASPDESDGSADRNYLQTLTISRTLAQNFHTFIFSDIHQHMSAQNNRDESSEVHSDDTDGQLSSDDRADRSVVGTPQNIHTFSFLDIQQHTSAQINWDKGSNSHSEGDTGGEITDMELSANDKSDNSGIVTQKTPTKQNLSKSSDMRTTILNTVPAANSYDPQTQKDKLGSRTSYSVSSFDDVHSTLNSKARSKDTGSNFSFFVDLSLNANGSLFLCPENTSTPVTSHNRWPQSQLKSPSRNIESPFLNKTAFTTITPQTWKTAESIAASPVSNPKCPQEEKTTRDNPPSECHGTVDVLTESISDCVSENCETATDREASWCLATSNSSLPNSLTVDPADEGDDADDHVDSSDSLLNDVTCLSPPQKSHDTHLQADRLHAENISDKVSENCETTTDCEASCASDSSIPTSLTVDSAAEGDKEEEVNSPDYLLNDVTPLSSQKSHEAQLHAGSLHVIFNYERKSCALVSTEERSHINCSVTLSSTKVYRGLQGPLPFSSPTSMPDKQKTSIHDTFANDPSPNQKRSKSNHQTIRVKPFVKPFSTRSSSVRLQYSHSCTPAGSMWPPGSALMSGRSPGFKYSFSHIQPPRQLKDFSHILDLSSEFPRLPICDRSLTHRSFRDLQNSAGVLSEKSSKVANVSEDSGTVRDHAGSFVPGSRTPNSLKIYVNDCDDNSSEAYPGLTLASAKLDLIKSDDSDRSQMSTAKKSLMTDTIHYSAPSDNKNDDCKDAAHGFSNNGSCEVDLYLSELENLEEIREQSCLSSDQQDRFPDGRSGLIFTENVDGFATNGSRDDLMKSASLASTNESPEFNTAVPQENTDCPSIQTPQRQSSPYPPLSPLACGSKSKSQDGSDCAAITLHSGVVQLVSGECPVSDQKDALVQTPGRECLRLLKKLKDL